MRLYLTALNPTDAVLDGFLPAAARLGTPITILTDRPEDWPEVDADVVGCEVRDARAVIDTVQRSETPAALLSNSDHLQTPTSLAADYLGLVGKDWRSTLRCKDKALTRRALAEVGLDVVASVSIGPNDDVALTALPYPAVVKPREGVASEDVYLIGDAGEFAARVAEIRGRRPGVTLVAEEYLHGEVHTFDTLGDGSARVAVGGWHTTLGAPPTFVEESLDWAPALPPTLTADLCAQLDALGVGFGACHTEFVMQDGRARLIEVNYRLIGDRMDLILAELLGVPLFEYVIRLHLGEELSDLALPDLTTMARHARVEYVCADRAGTLAGAPGTLDLRAGPTRLGCRPLRAVGVSSALTGTNRDYVAVLHAIGPDAMSVRTALAAFRAAHAWEITQ